MMLSQVSDFLLQRPAGCITLQGNKHVVSNDKLEWYEDTMGPATNFHSSIHNLVQMASLSTQNLHMVAGYHITTIFYPLYQPMRSRKEVEED